MKHVVKRNNRLEAFSEDKLLASLKATCISCGEKDEIAAAVAKQVTERVAKWMTKKTAVTSNDIRRMAGKYLSESDLHAGYVYLHHRIMG